MTSKNFDYYDLTAVKQKEVKVEEKLDQRENLTMSIKSIDNLGIM